ncbi:MAG: hypothetical protein PHC65_00960 [Methanobacteriaceae archaeon]|nr:hypothetical protein [Methanobacteriaceae archaeon]
MNFFKRNFSLSIILTNFEEIIMDRMKIIAIFIILIMVFSAVAGFLLMLA